VRGRVRPPGGPDKKVSYAACQSSSIVRKNGHTPIGRCLVVVESGMTVLRVSEVRTEDRNYSPPGRLFLPNVCIPKPSQQVDIPVARQTYSIVMPVISFFSEEKTYRRTLP
jgi:hypothetical protein